MYVWRGFLVPPGGLEPPRPKASDFESDVSTNFTTVASFFGTFQNRWRNYSKVCLISLKSGK